MLNGRLFQRGMSASAMKYFIESIYKDGGSNSLRKALNALNLHIEYWENHYNVTAHSMRRVSEQFEKVCNPPKTESDYIRQFDAEVKNSLSLSSSERKKLIKESAKEPTKVEVTTHIFSRNPHVVAERLLIANGKCEHCKKDAPFIRIKDGTPYLEVHHKEKLADGGEDTLENTIALCPNCHRKFHFGNPSA
ncbi:HNH endonuclease [Aeromonas veronii]|nr:HNH endonuclease [Aeromonas veronii bv. veronii]